MNQPADRPRPAPDKKNKDRLAEALKANLKRRKAAAGKEAHEPRG